MTQAIGEEGPAAWTAPCPGCGSAVVIQDGEAQIVHADCAGCGRRLIRVWTDTIFMITFSEWAGQTSANSRLPPPWASG
jgi:hypothetical protein